MKLIYERAGESARMLEPLDVPALRPADGMARKTELQLPRVAEPLRERGPGRAARLYGRASHAGRARLRARAGAGKGIPDRDHRHGRHDV